MALRLFVKRGAHRRFNRLALDAERLQVSVEWDRRSGQERRKSTDPADTEKRKGDRRGEPPFTWDAAEFVVVDDRAPEE